MSQPIAVLLVEDDEQHHRRMKAMLDAIPDTAYRVTWVATADQALEFLDGMDYDVCLVDLDLGSVTGIDVLRRLGPTSSVPCILITGNADLGADRAATEAGAVDFLVKTELTPRKLERAIRYAVGNARTLRSARESEQRFRAVVESAPDGVAMLDTRGRVVTCNAAFEATFGAKSGELIGVSFHSLVRSADGVLRNRLESTDVAAPATAIETEATARRADGSTVAVEVSLAPWTNEAGERVWSAIVRDVTERRARAGELVRAPLTDALTGLANGAVLEQRIEGAIAGLDRAQGSVAVVLIDVDDFGAVNDAHGSAVGDQLLTSVASRLLGCVRGGEVVAHIEAERFGVCLRDLEDPRSVLRLADRVLHAMDTSYQLDDLALSATCSIGIAVTSNTLANARDLLRHADSALRAAKLSGKSRYEVFEDARRGEIVEQMHLESDLRAAVASGQIDVAYQPVVQLGSPAIVGFEALARWRSPTRGEVSPAVFIAAAEDSGLIHQLGRLVLSQAVHQVAAWQQRFADRPPLSVAVNLSSRQLADPDLVGFVGDLLTESGLAPGTLTLEITESVMLGDVDRAVNLLSKFKELGVRLALDDFGTGYSSLNYLHLLPIDAVKVDQSFIGRIGGEDEEMVAAVAAIAQGLRLELVAEGIESGEQRRFLTAHGFRLGQGHLFSAAVSADEAADLLERLAARSPRGGPGRA